MTVYLKKNRKHESPPKAVAACHTCPTSVDWVCGSDGMSYPNKCLARCRGTRVACWRKCPCKGGEGWTKPTPRPGGEWGTEKKLEQITKGEGKGCGFSHSTAFYAEWFSLGGGRWVVGRGESPTQLISPLAPLAQQKPSSCSLPPPCPPAAYCRGRCLLDGSAHVKVCASDGVTYPSRCEAECRGLRVGCNGKCPCKKWPDEFAAGAESFTERECVRTCRLQKHACKRLLLPFSDTWPEGRPAGRQAMENGDGGTYI